MSIRERILAAAAVPTKADALFGEAVVLRGLSAAEQIAIFDGRPTRELLVPIVCAGVVDETGEAILKAEDFAGIRLDDEFERVYAEIIRMTRPPKEETEKNS